MVMMLLQQVGGRTVKVNFPEVPRGGEREVMGPKVRSSNRGYIDSPHKLYAGNLGWGLTSEGLRDAFADQQGLLSAKVIYERDSGRSRGFGFVSFETAEYAESALSAMNGVVITTWWLYFYTNMNLSYDILIHNNLSLCCVDMLLGGWRAAFTTKFGCRKGFFHFSSSRENKCR
jgi:hypothetical protein